MKTLLITHTDQDGSGSAIIGNIFLNINKVIYCSHNTIDEYTEHALDNNNFDRVYIVDIVPSEELVNNLDDRFLIIDHHNTAKFIKDLGHIWSNRSCGCKLFFKYLKKEFGKTIPTWKIDYCQLLSDIIDTADRFTYDKSKYKDQATDLDILHNFYGQNFFVSRFQNPRAIMNDFFLTKVEESQVRSFKIYRKRIFDNIAKNIELLIDGQGRRYTVIFRDEPSALLYHHILNINNLEYLISVNLVSNSVSLCSRNMDISKVAKRLGGGGHPKAAGFTISNRKNLLVNIKDQLGLDIFDKIKQRGE